MDKSKPDFEIQFDMDKSKPIGDIRSYYTLKLLGFVLVLPGAFLFLFFLHLISDQKDWPTGWELALGLTIAVYISVFFVYILVKRRKKSKNSF